MIAGDYRKSTELPPGFSIETGVANDIKMLNQFWEGREQRLRELFSRPTLRPSSVREVLLRFIVLQHYRSKRVRVHDCLLRCAEIASLPTVRRELDLMEVCDVVHMASDCADQRSVLVKPTEHLITFYNTRMPRLADEFERLMRSRADQGWG